MYMLAGVTAFKKMTTKTFFPKKTTPLSKNFKMEKLAVKAIFGE